ncbi:MAG: hypothetical protein M3R68_09895 [Acidobacteriota bacterium]|nr:hypothetical protein [Acidobacteriota bacterium]
MAALYRSGLASSAMSLTDTTTVGLAKPTRPAWVVYSLFVSEDEKRPAYYSKQ